MPSSNNWLNLTDELPLTILPSNSYQINGGTVIAGATQTSEAQPFTDTVTVSGIVATDKRVALSPRDAVVIPAGLALISVAVNAGTLSVTWKNTTMNPIAPPVAGIWSVAVLGAYLRP